MSRHTGGAIRLCTPCVVWSAACSSWPSWPSPIAGCGSSSVGSAGSSPTLQVLSYFPASSPYGRPHRRHRAELAVEQADPGAGAPLPDVRRRRNRGVRAVESAGIDYNKDIRPLFSNPIAVGTVASSGLTGSQVPPFLAVWVTKSASKLAALVGKLHGVRSVGTHDGAKLYVTGGGAAAIQGPTVMFSRSASLLEAALDRHARGQGFSAAEYAKATTGIAQDAAFKIFGDLTGELSTPQAAKARQVPWVAAIRGYGVSIGATPGGLAMTYHVDTSGAPLTSSQLPIAGGAAGPGLAGDLPVQAGIRDPAQTVNFILATLRETDPAGYTKFLRHVAALKRKSGLDVDAEANMLTGALNVESDSHTTIGARPGQQPIRNRGDAGKAVKVRLLGTEGPRPHRARRRPVLDQLGQAEADRRAGRQSAAARKGHAGSAPGVRGRAGDEHRLRHRVSGLPDRAARTAATDAQAISVGD